MFKDIFVNKISIWDMLKIILRIDLLPRKWAPLTLGV